MNNRKEMLQILLHTIKTEKKQMKKAAWNLALIGLFLASVYSITAQADPTKPSPSIGLTRMGVQSNVTADGNLIYYPDGKILVAQASPGGQRYVLVPVTYTNCNDSIPIYSFTFSVLYNPLALQAVGVQKNGPDPFDNLCFAKNFNIYYNDAPNTSVPAGFPSNLQQRLTITASSSIPLGLTSPSNSIPPYDCRKQDTVDLLYIRFLLKSNATTIPTASLLTIPNDTLSLLWNNWSPKTLYPGGAFSDQYFGLCGPDEIDWTGSVRDGGNYNTGRGTGNLVITNQPGIDLSYTYLDVSLLDEYDDVLRNFMYADSGTSAFQRVQSLDVIDSVPDTRIQNLVIQSDEPWLGIGDNQFGSGTTQYTVDLLDYTGDPLNRSQQLFIIVDVTYFEGNNPQGIALPSGLYKGVLTFTNDQTGNVPEKLTVPFIWQRNPDEGGVPIINPTGNPLSAEPNSGMHVLVMNSAQAPDTTLLTFGTGVGATDGVDSIFGESQLAAPPSNSSFWAYWYPPDSATSSTFFGMGDESDIHNYVVPSGLIYNSVSRDIRAYNPDTSIVYLCRYNISPSQFPVVVQWDLNEFPQGSRLILRDTLNGSRFSVDMRHATSGGGTIQSFTINDRTLSSFVIEYTPGTSESTPGIVDGWNLLSLPVFSPDPVVHDLFPDALNNYTAFLYFQNNYQQVSSLVFGRGYFVRFGSIITGLDTEVTGVRKFTIGDSDNVTVSDGWNAIGCISQPIQTFPANAFQNGITQGISFDPIGNNPTPVALNDAIWEYTNDAGYSEVLAMYPGRGYFVNIKGTGYLVENPTAPPVMQQGSGTPIGKDVADLNILLNQISVHDNAGRCSNPLYFGSTSAKININNYLLPPTPPSPLFDVRFATNSIAEPNVSSAGSILKIQTSDYPVVISAENISGNYEVTDLKGNVLGEFTDGNSGAITITNPKIQQVVLMAKSVTTSGNAQQLPTTESMTQNYPNPFSNLGTDFFYSVPTNEFVTVKVFNALGQEIQTLVNESIDPGTYKLHFDASNLPNGVYYYKMTAGGYTATNKMILMR